MLPDTQGAKEKLDLFQNVFHFGSIRFLFLAIDPRTFRNSIDSLKKKRVDIICTNRLDHFEIVEALTWRSSAVDGRWWRRIFGQTETSLSPSSHFRRSHFFFNDVLQLRQIVFKIKCKTRAKISLFFLVYECV